jgi:hypothetical protein
VTIKLENFRKYSLPPTRNLATKSEGYNQNPELPLTRMAVVPSKVDVDYSIKPEAVTPVVDTSKWPLLLKNYDKCERAIQ